MIDLAFKPKLKILITRVREGSLSGHLYQEAKNMPETLVETVSSVFDILDVDSYPTKLGDYDVVYNCSGITLNEAVLQHDHDNAKKVFDVNVIGAMSLTSEYAKQRIAKKKGGIIFHVGSTGSRKVFTNCSAYCASKAALAHYIMCAGYELKKDRIIVMGIHPGNMSGTQMTANVQLELQKNRGMTPEQIEAIYAEASDPADIASMMIGMLTFPVYDMSGENIYIENGRKG